MIIFCSVMSVHAQTFTEDIQKKDPTQGKVTIHQSADIDNLVNGKTPPAPMTTPKTTVEKTTTPTVTDKETTASEVKTEEPKEDVAQEKTEKKERKIVRKVREDYDEEAGRYTGQKKVMKGGQKVNGYRILVYSGSNREGKQRAQAAGQKVKGKYPGQPVFVHFNSPYWQCHVGNFRDRGDAQKVLNGIKSLGYSQACIVATKIRVQ